MYAPEKIFNLYARMQLFFIQNSFFNDIHAIFTTPFNPIFLKTSQILNLIFIN